VSDQPSVSREVRIALGELKNLAGFVMDQFDREVGETFIVAIALRMEALIKSESHPYAATDMDIQDALLTARVIKARAGKSARKSGETMTEFEL
jgi:hypothetical protein